MKNLKLGQSLEILANIAVLLGIIFLAIEISQNTAMIEAEMGQSRTESAMSEAQSVYNSEYLPEIVVALRKGEPITDVQAERVYHWNRSFHRNLDNQLRLYHQGLLSDDILRSMDIAVRDVVAFSPVTLEIWEKTKLQYSDEYVQIVDRVLAGETAISSER